MAKCSMCAVEHFRFRDALRTKPCSLCNACHAKYMRENRPKHSELDWMAKFKANARSYANEYQRRGHLKPEPCEDCGSDKAEKHHNNYHRPLEVNWVCRECHLKRHQQESRWVPCGPNAERTPA